MFLTFFFTLIFYTIFFPSEVQKESQAAENKSWPEDELLTYNKQVKQV